jgi:plastocyanin
MRQIPECCGGAARWRWAFFLPLVFGTLGLAGELSAGFPVFTLRHPATNYVAFVSFTLNYPLLALAILAAATKLVQTLRREAAHLPYWMVPVLGAVPGLMLGAVLIGLIGQPAAAGSAFAAPAGAEVVHLESSSFVPDIVAVRQGDKLLLVDDVPVLHILANGTWSADNRPVPGVEPGAVILNHLQLNNNSATVGPFTTSGTYHIYCTVHPGMNLTIVVA